MTACGSAHYWYLHSGDAGRWLADCIQCGASTVFVDHEFNYCNTYPQDLGNFIKGGFDNASERCENNNRE